VTDRFAEHVRRERREQAARLAAPLPPVCRSCGKTELAHKPEFVQSAFGPPQLVDRLPLKVPCLGYRENFEPAAEGT
jgi:hypothetical protein